MAIEITATEQKKIRKDARFQAAVAAHAEVYFRATAVDAEIDAVYATGSRDAMQIAAKIRQRHAAELAAAAKVVEKMILYGIFEA